MKPTPTADLAPLLAFGAHPDDIEFGVGGVIAKETRAGRPVHFVVCSRGEAGTNGTPAQRTTEAKHAAKLLGATIEFITLDGDAQLELENAHARTLAAIIRRIKPSLVLAPTTEQNQHPDHWRLGILVRDATRLARYGGLAALKKLSAHAIDQLLFYPVGPSAEPTNAQPILVDLSAPEIIAQWTAAMEAHASQLKTRNYVELQLTRARLHGLNVGIAYAQPLYPNDPLLVDSLSALTRGARKF
ncbi:PIG-L family deacetylase [Oleiharenicola lentus]|uniref:PIG-L family deacetylase n=1 Tax=Oleiharenicola lentus TaxID=2508720 RepID=UPI003F678E77